MKRFASLIMAAVLAVVTALALSGCETEPKTIEDYLSESPSAQQDIEESLSGLNNNDMDVQVTYEQNKIIITCSLKTTYKKNVRKTIKKSYKRYMEKHLTEPMENAVANIERETGIEGVSIQVIINNGNGKELWSETYPIADEPEATEETTGETEETSADDADQTE